MTITLEILVFMIVLRVWMILDDFKRDRETSLVTTALFSSFLLPTLSKMPNEDNVNMISIIGGGDILLYFIIISIIFIYIILCLKMINNLFQREYFKNSIFFWVDLSIVLISILSGVGIYLTPIIYFLYLTIPMFIYKVLSIKIKFKDSKSNRFR